MNEKTGPERITMADETELRAQLEAHHAAGFGWALTCCGRDRETAEDVLQTAYLKVLQGRARFHGRSSFKTWLFGVIRLTAADERRRRWMRAVGLVTFAREWERRPATVAGDDGMERAERQRAFREALAKLSRRQAEVLHLVFYQDLTIEEAADVMRVSVGSARTHYARGKQELREWLAGSEYGREDRR